MNNGNTSVPFEDEPIRPIRTEVMDHSIFLKSSIGPQIYSASDLRETSVTPHDMINNMTTQCKQKTTGRSVYIKRGNCNNNYLRVLLGSLPILTILFFRVLLPLLLLEKLEAIHLIK